MGLSKTKGTALELAGRWNFQEQPQLFFSYVETSSWQTVYGLIYLWGKKKKKKRASVENCTNTPLGYLILILWMLLYNTISCR